MTLLQYLLSMTIEDAEEYLQCRGWDTRGQWERKMKKMRQGADAAMEWLSRNGM